MGQRANSKRNADLDDKKRRAAGRQQNKPEVESIRNWRGPDKDRAATRGAFGRGGKANRAARVRVSGGGVGIDGKATEVGPGTRRTRKKTSR